MAFTNNFSTSFRYLDFFFGTDDKYRLHKKRVAEAKAAMKGASIEEQQKMEQKFAEQAEKEGQEAERLAEMKGPKWLGGSEKKSS